MATRSEWPPTPGPRPQPESLGVVDRTWCLLNEKFKRTVVPGSPLSPDDTAQLPGPRRRAIKSQKPMSPGRSAAAFGAAAFQDGSSRLFDKLITIVPL